MSNGGVLVLRALEKQLKFSRMIARCMTEKRDPNGIIHTLVDMIRERMFAIPCGHEECNDLEAAPKCSRWRTAAFETIRGAFLKIAVRVEELKSRIKLSFPTFPQHKMLALLMDRIKAQSP